MVSFLQEHHIEIPNYNTLKTILEKALINFEKHLESILTKYLTSEDNSFWINYCGTFVLPGRFRKKI